MEANTNDPSAGVQTGRDAVDLEYGSPLHALLLALRLSFGSAIALGFVRFSYALLLPAMKADLGWTFAQAGAMNTANAAGYLLGAVVFPFLARRRPAAWLFMTGACASVVLTAMCGMVAGTSVLLVQRLVTGIASALIFIGGGVLAARLANAVPRRGGLMLGLYYGGTGFGIVLPSLFVPAVMRPVQHGWQPAWFALAAACAVSTAIAWGAARRIEGLRHVHARAARDAAGRDDARPTPLRRYAPALAGYGLFGVGYIGYMTFIIALLRSEGMSQQIVTGFYIALGIATIVSARIWSGFLDRMRGGQALATFNAVLAVATLMPAVQAHPVVAFVSGLLFGSTFLSAVASTTAFVRHNLPAHEWTRGISAFTIVFAAGQIAGPVIIGWVSDNADLARGLVYSAAILLAGAVLAAFQRAIERRA